MNLWYRTGIYMTDNVHCQGGVWDEAKADYNTKTETPLSQSECKLFQVFFLMNDDDQNVIVVETSEIDLEEVIGCLKQGDSVFITCNSST